MQIQRNYDTLTGHVTSVLLREVSPNYEKLHLIQSRAEMRYDTVDQYAAMMVDGVEFDPCLGVFDEKTQTIWIWDGCHRVEAARKASKTAGGWIQVLATYGREYDAEWLAYSANAKHGMQRTNEDIQRIVKSALKHQRAANLSNRELGRHCGVNDKTVAKYRKELEASAEIPQMDEREVTRNGKTFVQKTGRIGAKSRDTSGKAALPRCLFCHKECERIFAVREQPSVGICQDCTHDANQHWGETR